MVNKAEHLATSQMQSLRFDQANHIHRISRVLFFLYHKTKAFAQYQKIQIKQKTMQMMFLEKYRFKKNLIKTKSLFKFNRNPIAL